MSVNLSAKSCAHSQFINLPSLLQKDSLLVFNRTRVLPARFKAKKSTGAAVEALYLSGNDESIEAWLQGRVKAGDSLHLENGPIVRVKDKRDKRVRLEIGKADFEAYLWKAGYAALPPYIRRVRKLLSEDLEKDSDSSGYQTPWAVSPHLGDSVAAPTASLHFDKRLLEALEAAQIPCAFIELQVGLGTFEPLQENTSLSQQELHEELYFIEESEWEKIENWRKPSRPICAVGTTSLRALESAALSEAQKFLRQGEPTRLFIRPGFEFRMADSLITNFHQSQSSLLVLVATFLARRDGDYEFWKSLYEEAVRESYRLFSYGDGLLIQSGENR